MPQIASSSHVVSAAIMVPEEGAAGVICAQGGRFGGWAIYCHEGRVVYCHNTGEPRCSYIRAEESLAPGAHKVRYEFTYDGGGHGKGGTGSLFVDALMVATGKIEATVPFFFFEGFDVGADLYTTVTDEIQRGDNAFSGEISYVRIDLGEHLEIPPEERARIGNAVQ
jgi:arylsulfatase